MSFRNQIVACQQIDFGCDLCQSQQVSTKFSSHVQLQLYPGRYRSKNLPGKANEEKNLQKHSMAWKRSLNPLCYNKHSSTIYILQYYKEYYKVTVYSKSNFPTSFNLTAPAYNTSIQESGLWVRVMYMYVWGRLHVHGRRISVRARHRQKFKDSYPLIKKNVFYRVNFETF